MKLGALAGALACALAAAPRAAAAAAPAVAPTGPARDAAQLVERAGCKECHNPDGVANDTRLVFPGPGAPAKALDAFADDLLDLVDPANPERSRLLRKPTKRMEHAGGQKIAPGSADEAVLRAWVLHLARYRDLRVAREVLGPGGRMVPPGRPRFRRLTASQYDNTVRDLLGDLSGPARQFPPEDFTDGFKNQIQGQASSPLLIEAFSVAAQKLAENAVKSIRAGDPRKLLPCPPAARNAGCRERFVREFGRRAFRRPLTAAEVERFGALAAGQGDFLTGVRAVVETMLQSPSFLYLSEPADPAHKPYARASRLAYFLWNTTPDEALLEAAGRGELDSPEGLERVARRMLEGEAAIPAVEEFMAQWLRFDQLLGGYKDRRAFPEFTRETALAMVEETRRFLGDLIWNEHSFLGIFDAGYSFVNSDLAKIYGMPAPRSGDGEFERVAYPEGSERIGLLGHGLFLAATSKPTETSPTARGLFVREHLLCQKVPPPPPGVDMNLPPLAGEKPLTNRQRLDLHLGSESCAGCHRLIDSIGYGFERFDAIGRRHDRLKLTLPRRAGEDEKDKARTVELELDTRGTILGLQNAAFSSPREIGLILARSVPAQQCVAKQVFRYALGRLETAADHAVIDQIYDDFKTSRYKFKQLLVSVAKWTEFGFDDKEAQP